MIYESSTPYKSSRVYIEGGCYHRLDGPAVTYYYPNGLKSHEYYYVDGLLHREDGPAIIFYDINENIFVPCNMYFYGNIQYKCSSDQEFKKLIKLLIFK